MNKLIDQLESNYQRIKETNLPIDDASRHKMSYAIISNLNLN